MNCTRTCLVLLLSVALSSASGLASAPTAPPGAQGTATAPADAPVSLTLGPVVISTYNPVTITPFENGTNLYFVARNTDTRPLTIHLTSWSELQAQKPSWMFHFFKLFGFATRPGDPPGDVVVVPAGESRTLEFYCSKDINGGPPQQADLPFRFAVLETGHSGTLTITIKADDTQETLRTRNGVMTGTVRTPDGTPLAGVEVTAALYNDRGAARAFTNSAGAYRIEAPSIDDVRVVLGSRPLPYPSPSYFLTANLDGYRMGYVPGLVPATGTPVVTDFSLAPLTAPPVYRMVGQFGSDGVLAYWWTRFAGANRDRVVSVQGQHPVVPPGPGHIVGLDLQGQQVWRVETGSECWGLDVTADGLTTAAGCYDGYVYIVDSGTGVLRHKVRTSLGGGWVQTVKFAPNGRQLVADGAGSPSFATGISVIDVQTGTISWSSTVTGAYRAVWTADGDLVTGRTGDVAKFSPTGTLRWRVQMGESPLWLETDTASNIYYGGKTRTLMSLDANGVERWRYRVGSTPNSAAKGITTDGTLMVTPGFNGQLQAFTQAGVLVWQRFMPGLFPTVPPCPYGPGHNALSMTPDASLITVAGRCYNVDVYDRAGSLVWTHKAVRRSDFRGSDSYGNYTGAQSTDITPDGRYIAVGYADASIRIFKLGPTMTASPASLRFGAVKSGTSLTAVTAAQSVRLTATGAALGTWTATSNQPWLQITNGTGSAAGQFTASIVNPSDAIGTQQTLTATITVTAPDAVNSPMTIPVTLTVDQSGGAASLPPFGVVDTPAGDATVLAGSIAVTGWTLDNIGVQRVELWRDLQPGETTPPGNSTAGDPRNGKIFIANATFVENARPDIEGLYPTTPANYRAGWGYLMLTWGLFGQGNGTYTFYAFGVDQEGNTATIGSKTVVISNNTATKPFGSIDTPAIGGDASGPNFGWGLTPKVNGAATCKIPSNGIQVSIDSGPLQPVVYGSARSDIAGAFPAFSNSAAAGGHFIFDWSTLTNGLHTIGWLITDDCNRADGVGSRFFNVTNGVSAPGATSDAAFRLKSETTEFGRVASGLPYQPISSAFTRNDDVLVSRGYGQLSEIVTPDEAGVRTIELKQGERIEVRLPRGFDSAHQIDSLGRRRALPTGATWDEAGSIFYWQPAPAFLGRYRLVFSNGAERITVGVVVRP